MKYGFIGAGNMAGAIIAGMTVKTGMVAGEDIYIYDIKKEAMKRLEEDCGVKKAASIEEVAQKADVIILSVKPNILPAVAAPLKAALGEKKTFIISIAVGKTLAYLSSLLGEERILARVMPNINAKVSAAVSGYCLNENAGEKEREILVHLFETVGSVIEIGENHFSIFAAMAGSAPAFAYLYIDALARAAQKAGMPKSEALAISAQTALGSAKMILESAEHPWALIDQVCSPGGTTIEGIAKLQQKGFEAALLAAFDAVLEKDKMISEK